MRNLKVSAKLILGFLIVAVLAAVVGTVGMIGLMSSDSNYTEALDGIQASLSTLGNVRETYQLERVSMRNICLYLYSHQTDKLTAEINTLKEHESSLEKAFAEYEATIDDKSQETEYFTAKDTYEGVFATHRDELVAAAQAGNADAAMAALELAAQNAVPIASGLAKTVDYNNEMVQKTSAQLTVNTNMSLLVQIIVLVIAAVAAILLGIYNASLIGKPVRLLASIMNGLVETGNFDMSAETSRHVEQNAQYKDELGQMSLSFKNLMGMMQEKFRTLEAVSDGDLTVDVGHKSDKDTMGEQLQKMVDNLNAMFGEINQSTEQVSAGARQVADGSQALAQGSTEQAAAVEQLSSSISEIAQKTRDNASQANKAAELAGIIKHNAEKGSEQMGQMMRAVQDINEASQAISRVIKVIDDIAFQTNILALNAAVEAARAGQHGKGFAVVAEEVRNLAAKSAEAAKDTGSLIANSMEKAALGAKIADETSASLVEIVSGINESSVIVGGIAASSEEQAAAIGQINSGIDQVAQVVQQNSATAEESAAASEEMSSQSSILQELVARFKLKDTGGRRMQSAKPARRQLNMPAKPADADASDAYSGFGKY